MATPGTAPASELDHRFVTVDGLEIHYTEWGSDNDEVVVCLHGFSSNCRQFDSIARALATDYRVVCPDLPGRGLSQWSDAPQTDYTREAYDRIATGFVDVLGIDTMHWIGISLGGSVGISVAGGRLRDRITTLVLNDIGPGPVPGSETEDHDGGERIQSYLRNPSSFDTYAELEAHYRDIYAPMSPLSDAEWRRYTIAKSRRRNDGTVGPNYDTAIVDPYFEKRDELSFWEEWDAIDAEVLVLRGEESDILSTATFEEMQRRGPACRTLEFPDCGHIPALNVDEQIEPVVDFLQAN